MCLTINIVVLLCQELQRGQVINKNSKEKKCMKVGKWGIQ